MPAIIRNTGPRGPRFYEDGGELKFVNTVDASTRDGPRDATDEDRVAHPEAFAAYERNDESMFPGAKPMIAFSGKRPPGVPDPELLAKPAEPAKPERQRAS